MNIFIPLLLLPTYAQNISNYVCKFSKAMPGQVSTGAVSDEIYTCVYVVYRDNK